MNKITLFETKSIFRDALRVTGLSFGEGEKSMCVVGSMRGNEYQQIYACSQLIKTLGRIEDAGKINPGHQILVIPCVNSYSMNINKRFWPTDNTDINRMFPGYDKGETTQRIADGLFESVKDYKNGVQFASFYMPGNFVPHVRMLKTGYENVEAAKLFGMPHVVLRNPRPYDTTTLNYNWQIWGANAFSIYTSETESINKETADAAVKGILNYMAKQEIITYRAHNGYISSVIADSEMVSVKSKTAGIFTSNMHAGSNVTKGDVLAKIIDPYSGEVCEEVVAPVTGTVFFLHNAAMTYSNAALFKIIPLKEF